MHGVQTCHDEKLAISCVPYCSYHIIFIYSLGASKLNQKMLPHLTNPWFSCALQGCNPTLREYKTLITLTWVLQTCIGYLTRTEMY